MRDLLAALFGTTFHMILLVEEGVPSGWETLWLAGSEASRSAQRNWLP
ncbi:MAG: hypothetical protein OXH85_03570 [Truepera sp.]|nr:hypothetical protein [Truepera sp.]